MEADYIGLTPKGMQKIIKDVCERKVRDRGRGVLEV